MVEIVPTSSAVKESPEGLTGEGYLGAALLASGTNLSLMVDLASASRCPSQLPKVKKARDAKTALVED